MSEYKRLTRKDGKGNWVAEAGHYGVYLDSEVSGATDMIYGDIVNRLAELENKIESGEFVEFPRKYESCGWWYVEYFLPNGDIMKEPFWTEGQADDLIEKEKARLRRMTSG